MDEAIIERMKELYGLNPNSVPFALQFPRLPPGILQPMPGIRNSPKEQFKSRGEKITPQLKDFKEMYQKFASGLIDFNSSTLIPPGHPLFSRQNSVETLRAENNKLKKENLELKSQLNKSDSDQSKHNP